MRRASQAVVGGGWINQKIATTEDTADTEEQSVSYRV
jgi:hypothetical protein